MYFLTQLFDMDTAKKVGNNVEFVLRRLFGEYSLKHHSHEPSQLQVFKHCTGMSQPSVCISSRTTSSTTSTTSSSASDVFHIHFEDTDEVDVLSVNTEVDIYLLEHRIAREKNFDILEWWK